jgi:hypothetical protein
MSVTAVFDNGDLREDIISRVDTVTSLVASSMVSKEWLKTALSPTLLKILRLRYGPPLLGFISEFDLADWRYIKFTPMGGIDGHLEVLAASAASSFVGQRRFDAVVYSRDGIVVSKHEGDGDVFTSRCLLGRRPTTVVQPPPIAHVNGARSGTLCARFVVLGDDVAFFHGDGGGEGEHFTVCVSTLRQGVWNTEVSPLQAPIPATRLEKPYAVVSGNVLHMMYALGVVVSCDLATFVFSFAFLPPSFHGIVDKEYVVAKAGAKDLCILSVRADKIQHWFGDMSSGIPEWKFVREVDLSRILQGKISALYWGRLKHGPPYYVAERKFFTIHLQDASDDGASAIVSFGFTPVVYYLDFVTFTSHRITNAIDVEFLGGVHLATVPWPPFYYIA